MYNLSLAIIINVRRLHEIKTLCKCLQPSVERITQRRFTANFPQHTANFSANQVHLRKILENLGHNFLPEEKGCMYWMRSAPEWWRRQTGDANVHKFAPQPNWARGPYWCSFARCAESEVEEVEAADATLSNVNSSKSSNWGDFSGVHFGSSKYPAFDRALLFHIWGSLKWKVGQRILGSFNRRGMDDDYWVGDFDKDKNCQQEKKIEKLINEVGVPSQVLQKLFDHFAGKWWYCPDPVLNCDGIFPKCSHIRFWVNMNNFLQNYIPKR